MTRLESSARDYAIARLAAGDDLWPVIRDYRGPGYEAAIHAWQHCSEADLPIVRARVALYLRLLRRVEAWEAEGCLWSGWAAPGWVFTRKGIPRKEPARMQWTPWRPLWTSAPPHEAGVTARMRRGRMEALGREAPGPEVVR